MRHLHQRLFIASCLVLACAALSSCLTDASGPPPTWMKTLDLHPASHMVESASGNFLVADSDELVLLDPEGREIRRTSLETRFDGVTNFVILNITPAPDDAFTVTGFDRISTSDIGDVMMFDLNQTGQPENIQIAAGDVSDYYPMTCYPRREGFTCLSVVGEQINTTKIKAFKLNASGAVAEELTYTLPNSNPQTIELAVPLTDDSGYLLVTTNNPISGPDTLTSTITRLDDQLNPLWSIPYGRQGSNYVQAMAEAPDGGYVFAGTLTSLAWFFKISPEGELVWDKTYGKNIHTTNRSVFDITAARGGGYILAGCKYPGGPVEDDVWLLKISEEGDYIWDVVHGGDQYDCAYSIIQTTDGGYAVAGGTYPSQNAGYRMLVLKLDEHGKR
jgi:hypothetical protein